MPIRLANSIPQLSLESNIRRINCLRTGGKQRIVKFFVVNGIFLETKAIHYFCSKTHIPNFVRYTYFSIIRNLNWPKVAEVILANTRKIITLAQTSILSQSSDSFFPSDHNSHLCLHSYVAYILFMRSTSSQKKLIMRCALAHLQKYVHVGHFPACALVLNI